MIIMRFLTIAVFMVVVCNAQTKTNSVSTKTASTQTSSVIKSSPAYAEILLQKVILEAELEDLLFAYTEDFPKVKQTRFKLNLVEQALNKIMAVKPSETSKLTEALGKIVLQKIEYETQYEDLRKNYSDSHPDVKRAKRKVEIFDKAVKEILP